MHKPKNTHEEFINAALLEDQQTIDALWAQEAERRAKEIEEGIVKAIPGDEVVNRLRARYKR